MIEDPPFCIHILNWSRLSNYEWYAHSSDETFHNKWKLEKVKFSVHKKNKFLSYLKENGIETRPILSGNFMNQKSISLYKLNEKKKFFKNSQTIEDSGFFIGLHTKPIDKKVLDKLIHHLLKIEDI